MSRKIVYPFGEMKVGDVLDIPRNPDYDYRVGGDDPIYSAACHFGKRHGRRFQIQKAEQDGKVVFRVKRVKFLREGQ